VGEIPLLGFSLINLAKRCFLDVQSYKETSLSIERGGKGVFSKMNKVIQTMFNLSLTPRWVGHITTFKDTTATHSYRVSVLTLIAALIKKEKYGININIEKAVLKALFHDFNEDKIGPIKHKTKKSAETEIALKKLERDQAKEVLKMFPEEIRSEFKDYVVDGEDGSIEGRLVDLVDSFDALLFCHRENKHQNSIFFRETYDEVKETLLLENDETINSFISSLEKRDQMKNFFECILDLSTIQRWSGRYNTVEDDVAGHTFRMATLGAMLTKYEDETNDRKIEDNDTLDIVSKILFHDVPETIYGDVRGPIKESTEEVSEAFEELERKISKDLCEWIPKEIRGHIEEYLINAKDLSQEEGVYVDILDKLDALNKSLMEVSRRNDEYKRIFSKILREVKKMYEEYYVINYYYSNVLLELQLDWIFD